MSHFYGGIIGNRGEATRAGSKGSGYNAWCQDRTAMVDVFLRADDDERTLANIEIRSASINYGGGRPVEIASGLDIAAILDHQDDPSVRACLEAARVALQEASTAATDVAGLVAS